jgi:hypothetical protein
MARDANIPLFLWVATALLAHIMWGGGAGKVVEVLEDKHNVRRFALSVQRHVDLANKPLEVTLEEVPDETELDDRSLQGKANEVLEPLLSDDATPEPENQRDRELEPENTDNKTQNEIQKDKTQPQRKQPEPEDKKELEKQEKQPEKKKDEPVPIPAPPELNMSRRVAVEQHVADENQKDNPDARFIAEHANHVAEETQARITSLDENSAAPSPGSDHRGPTDDPGNAMVTDVAQSTDAPGDAEEAPSDTEEESDGKTASMASAPGAQRAGEQAMLGIGQQPLAGKEQQAAHGQQARSAQAATEASPQVVDGHEGAWYLRPAVEAREEQRARRAAKQRQARKGGATGALRQLGTLNATPGGLNPNLNASQALAAIGEEQLKQERLADGERRRSKHRGSWRAVGLERWKSALENYVAGVKPGNQTALNTAHSPFASYLNKIHRRLHPQFAERVLTQLDELPGDHPMNNPNLRTDLEIVLSSEDGRVVRMGVIRSSGVTAFDIEPLESVQRAAPFGAPPREIVSPDGNVYLQWGFHRDPIYACSTFAARPFLLRVAPKSAPPEPAPEKEPPRDERPVDGNRHGRLQTENPKRQDG